MFTHMTTIIENDDFGFVHGCEMVLILYPYFSSSGSFAMAGQSKHFRSANVQNFNRSTNVDLSTSPPLLQNCLLCLRCSSRPVVSQRWKSHTLCQVLACALAGATWQCVWL